VLLGQGPLRPFRQAVREEMAVGSFWVGPMYRPHGRPGEDGGDHQAIRQAGKHVSRAEGLSGRQHCGLKRTPDSRLGSRMSSKRGLVFYPLMV